MLYGSIVFHACCISPQTINSSAVLLAWCSSIKSQFTGCWVLQVTTKKKCWCRVRRASGACERSCLPRVHQQVPTGVTSFLHNAINVSVELNCGVSALIQSTVHSSFVHPSWGQNLMHSWSHTDMTVQQGLCRSARFFFFFFLYFFLCLSLSFAFSPLLCVKNPRKECDWNPCLAVSKCQIHIFFLSWCVKGRRMDFFFLVSKSPKEVSANNVPVIYLLLIKSLSFEMGDARKRQICAAINIPSPSSHWEYFWSGPDPRCILGCRHVIPNSPEGENSTRLNVITKFTSLVTVVLSGMWELPNLRQGLLQWGCLASAGPVLSIGGSISRVWPS